MIIAAYAGTGKTTAAKLNPETVIDFVCMPYKYYLNPIQNDMDSETCKANSDNIMRSDWPFNYVSALKDSLGKNKILLIPTDLNVLSLLQDEKIPYILCYPQRSAKKIYRKRFIERGNTEEFIEVFIGGWDRYLVALEEDTYGKQIVLENYQFINDIIEKLRYNYYNKYQQKTRI